MAVASAVECTATVRMPISWQARWMRSAISPRLAMRTCRTSWRSRPMGEGPIHASGPCGPAAAGRPGNPPPHSTIISGSPYSTGVPLSIRMRVTVPARGALIWLKVFIASISSRVWPCATLAPSVTKGGCPGSGAR